MRNREYKGDLINIGSMVQILLPFIMFDAINYFYHFILAFLILARILAFNVEKYTIRAVGDTIRAVNGINNMNYDILKES